MTRDQRREAFLIFRKTLPKDYSDRLSRFFLDLTKLEEIHGTEVVKDAILYASMSIEFAAEEYEGEDLGWEVNYCGRG